MMRGFMEIEGEIEGIEVDWGEIDGEIEGIEVDWGDWSRLKEDRYT